MAAPGGENEGLPEDLQYQETDDDSDDSEDSLDDPQEVPQQQPRPNAVYNSSALHEKLEEIGWPDGIDWVQTLTANYDHPGDIDVNDDLSREMAFYTQALEGTREAYAKLQANGIPFLRPEDYYAEMVKSDTHMLKVKDMLLSQRKQFEEVEERRKSREAKRFSKEVQAEKLKERAQQKKQNIDSVKKWRKMRQDRGFAGGEEEFPVDFDERRPSNKKRKLEATPRARFDGNPGRKSDATPRAQFGGKGSKESASSKRNAAPWDRSGGKNSRKGGASKNRRFRDAKYGHGGKKSLKKKNTAESAGLFGHKGRSDGNRGKQKKR